MYTLLTVYVNLLTLFCPGYEYHLEARHFLQPERPEREAYVEASGKNQPRVMVAGKEHSPSRVILFVRLFQEAILPVRRKYLLALIALIHIQWNSR